MDMPITKPSMVAYADQLEFSQLLEELSQTKKNGFIRVTSGSEDGYLLFKDGKQVAASYDNLSKLEAINKIKLAMEDYKTLVEVFDIRPSQVSYLMGLNKPYLLEKVPDIEEVLGELKKDKNQPAEGETSKESEETSLETGSDVELPLTQDTGEPSEVPEVPESSKEPSADETSNTAENAVKAESSPEALTEEVVVAVEKTDVDSENEVGEESPSSPSPATPDNPLKKSPETSAEALSEVVAKISGTATEISQPETVEDETGPEDNSISAAPDMAADSGTAPTDEANPVGDAVEESSPTENEEPMDRLELLKKYGIKDIDEEDVEKVLESYTGGYLSDNDVEKVELTLMNRIKKSIMGLPKVKGTEVMIFLDNAGNDLRGNVNVIMEYQSQGFISRIVGGSKEINNLKRQVIGICNMEIRKIFREYPEVVDKFEINVEIS